MDRWNTGRTELNWEAAVLGLIEVELARKGLLRFFYPWRKQVLLNNLGAIKHLVLFLETQILKTTTINLLTLGELLEWD